MFETSEADIVAQFKYTIAVRKEGPIVICGLPLDISKFEKNINHAIFSKDTNLIINSYIEFCNYCSNIGFNSLAENYGRKAIEY